MTQLIEVIDDYNVRYFFYISEEDQQMTGIDENSRTFGYIDPRTSQVRILNRDFSRAYEQQNRLHREFSHGVRIQDQETMRQFKDSVGNYGFRRYRKVA